MDDMRKLCPVCGAANPMEEEKCWRCGEDMGLNLPTLWEEKLPVPWKEVGASLALGAVALILRSGLHLLRGFLERREGELLRLKMGSSQRRETEEIRAPLSQARVWGRRARGVWRSDGTSCWEVEDFLWERKK